MVAEYGIALRKMKVFQWFFSRKYFDVKNRAFLKILCAILTTCMRNAYLVTELKIIGAKIVHFA